VSGWEGATAAYYESVYNNDENDAVDDSAAVVGGFSDGGVVCSGGGTMVDAVVEILLTNINTISGNANGKKRLLRNMNAKRRRSIDESQRNLQQEVTNEDVSVVVMYTQSTTYRSRQDYPDAIIVCTNELLKLPLSTELYREGYVLELKQRLFGGYDELTLVSSISTPFDNNAAESSDDIDYDNNNNNEADVLSFGTLSELHSEAPL